MRAHKPDTLLLSEAPGYKGARLTGVPFTSEYHLLNGVSEFGFFGKDKGYRKTNEFSRQQKEQSATIVWKALAEAGWTPLMWASFPFHPHQKSDPWSNRKPTKEEVVIGQKFFRDIVAIFGVKHIVAVGRVAETCLASLGVRCEAIRHPANGGAKKFRSGILRAINKTQR